MKRKIIALLCAMSLALTGCSSDVAKNKESGVGNLENEENAIREPDLTQIRSICKLATLECYYHNVAKSTKAAGSGLMHLGESDRKFWTEYNGIVKIGVDMSKGTIDVDGTDVTVYMPNAEIISIKLDSESIQDPITDHDSFLNSNPIDSDDVTGAIDDAQSQIRASIENDSSLLASAQERAEKLIENYIDQLGEASDVKFNLRFESVGNSTSSDKTK